PLEMRPAAPPGAGAGGPDVRAPAPADVVADDLHAASSSATTTTRARVVSNLWRCPRHALSGVGHAAQLGVGGQIRVGGDDPDREAVAAGVLAAERPFEAAVAGRVVEVDEPHR